MASAAPFVLGGVPIRLMASPTLANLSCTGIENRVLVLVQLHGGNDGLNTAIPVNQYSRYKTLRPNIAIPDTGTKKFINLDTSLSLANQVGLHPEMTGFKALYDQGKMALIQGVSYPNNNKSHFKATDDWLTGGDNTTNPTSGWVARYLDHYYPNFPADYPNTEMPDPIGLELGSRSVSLMFHRSGKLSTGLALTGSPGAFYTLVSGTGGLLPTTVPTSDFGDKLSFLMGVQQNGDSYAQRLNQVYNAGSNSSGVTYPTTYHTTGVPYYNNILSSQLKVIARLLKGGLKTKVFLVRLTGFDTHNGQVVSGATATGRHAVLLYHLSGAVKAFQDDLKALGIEDKVMTVSFSEFGRRATQNGSLGTDHGTLAPMFVFGKGVKAGVKGSNPNLSNLNRNNLQGLQFDYRRVYTTLLQDWLGADDQTITATTFSAYKNQKLDLINNTAKVDPSCYLQPFPIGLLGFDARVKRDGHVICEWRTASEVNNDFFTVERSKDGQEFEALGRIKGAGTSQAAHSYDFIDPDPHLGLSYYRLRQTDYDGSNTYYQKVAVQVDPEVQDFTYEAWPNPASDHINLRIHTQVDSPARLDIYNLQGQLIRNQDLLLTRGQTEHRIDLAGIQSGTYLMRVTNGQGERFVFRMWKQ